MGRICKEIHEWIEEEVERRIVNYEERSERRCRERRCRRICLCCNKWFCWIETFVVKVVRWVTETIGKWTVRIVCESVSYVLDGLSFIVFLILSIPIVGGLIRPIINWASEVLWKLLSVPDIIGSFIGIKGRKKMYFSVIIPSHDGTPIANEIDLKPQVDSAIEHFDRLCNINLIFTGFCTPSINAPKNPFIYPCDIKGYFTDWWISGSYFEYTSAICKFEDNWRRLLGYGGEIIVFVVDAVDPEDTDGCSMTGTTNYVMTESGTSDNMIAHEIGHACLLGHKDDDTNNLMYPSVLSTNQILTNSQVSIIRSSRHCTYI